MLNIGRRFKLSAGEDRGFTLLETVIVLAIGGMILALVFSALGSAQASKRDTQRKQDLQRMNDAIQLWATQTGSYPAASDVASSTTNFMTNYFQNLKDPSSGSTYQVVFHSAQIGNVTNTPTGTNTIDYTIGYYCVPNDPAGNYLHPAALTRSYTVMIKLEQGGGITCNDNQAF